MLVLDRVLDGDDVARLASIQFVDQRRQRRRLARAGPAADEHQAARELRQVLHLRRQRERRQSRHIARQRADGGRRPAALAVQVDAEASDARQAERRVGDAVALVDLAGVRRHRGEHGALDVRPGQGVLADRHDALVDARRRRGVRHQQQVRAAALDHLTQPGLEPARVRGHVDDVARLDAGSSSSAAVAVGRPSTSAASSGRTFVACCACSSSMRRSMSDSATMISPCACPLSSCAA